MTRILLTGFEPFGGRDVNPAQRLVNDAVAPLGVELKKLILPVEFIKSGEILRREAALFNPDIILSIGQAGNAPHISIERVAVNLDNSLASNGSSLFADACGDAPTDRAIVPDGPAAYFATLPIWKLVNAVNTAGVPCRASYSAGTYVCNHIMYTGCDIAAKTSGMISGFVHVPFLPEQLGGSTALNGRYAMEYGLMLKGIQEILEQLEPACPDNTNA